MSNYVNRFKKMVGKAKEKVSSAIVFRETEVKIIESFLDLNKMTFRQFVYMLLHNDGAITDELLLAEKEVYPRAPIPYIEDRDLNFAHFDEFKGMDWETIFKNDSKKLKSVAFRYVMLQEIKNYYIKNGYNSFTHYIKSLINKYGVYPVGSYEVLKKYIRTDFVINPDKKHMKVLETSRKRQLKNRSTRVLDENSEKISEVYSFGISKLEKEMIIKPFSQYLKSINLTLAKVILYEMTMQEIISLEESKLGDEEVAAIKNINYEPQKQGVTFEFLKVKVAEANKYRSSVAVSFPTNPKIKKAMNKIFGTWVKYNVIKKHGAYPIVDQKDVSDLFANVNKQKTVLKK